MTEDEMYEAVIHNDTDYDGFFFYGVRSTGIFCRPSCPSRKPLRENLCFFPDAGKAMEAGFRPCKRCRSDLFCYHPLREIAEQVKAHLDEQYLQRSTWNTGLHEIGLSERRLVEVFKDAYGMTPRAYMDTLRLREAERLLSETNCKVIDIAGAVGFGSLSTFNRFFREQTGDTPSHYRRTH